MKINPKPASVENTRETGDRILRSKGIAARVTKASLSRQDNPQKIMYGHSIYKGPIKDAIAGYDGDRLLTIFSSGHDQSPEHNEVKGHLFRKIFFKGTT
jgi:hypothetical protein